MREGATGGEALVEVGGDDGNGGEALRQVTAQPPVQRQRQRQRQRLASRLGWREARVIRAG